jgi:hypothetical protein
MREDRAEDLLPRLPLAGSAGLMRFLFAIVDVQTRGRGLLLRLAARADGNPAGLSILVLPAGPPDPQLAFLGLSIAMGKAELRSDGKATDTLLWALARLFDVPLEPESTARPQIDCDCISLIGDLGQLRRVGTYLKIVHGVPPADEAGKAESEYFELLLDVDVPQRMVILSEKWTAYRPALIRGLCFNAQRDAH